MSIEKETSRTNVSSSATSIPVISRSFGEGLSLQITNHKLNGKNFLLWSQPVLLVSEGEGRWAISREKFNVPKSKIKTMPIGSLTTP